MPSSTIPPAHAVESASAICWLEDGIIFIFNKYAAVHGKHNATENVEQCDRLSGPMAKTLLMDITGIQSMSREARQAYASACDGKVNAIALIVSSPANRLLGNFFLGFNKPSAPVQLFSTVQQARQWLTGFA